MSVLNELGAFLVSNGVGTLNTSIFLGKTVDNPDAIVSLYEYGGNPPVGGMGVVGAQYMFPGVQLVFRGAPEDYATPRTAAKTVYNLLFAVQPDTLFSGVKYLSIQPQQEPFLLKRDERKRVYIAFNVICEKEPS